MLDKESEIIYLVLVGYDSQINREEETTYEPPAPLITLNDEEHTLLSWTRSGDNNASR